MNDYSSNNYKKDSESNNLNYFIESYNALTGIDIQIYKQSERPDFICQFPKDEKVGIELTKIIRDPRDKQWDMILNRREFIHAEDAISMILDQIFDKNKKLQENDWCLPNNTILVIELYAISLSDIFPVLTVDNFSDVFSLNFKEIWLGDYTQVEPFNCIDLFCIAPAKMFGTYTKFNQFKKPYG